MLMNDDDEDDWGYRLQSLIFVSEIDSAHLTTVILKIYNNRLPTLTEKCFMVLQ